jgi:hypothetical protein
MNLAMLGIQQYLHLHPVANLETKLKTKYMKLLQYFVSETVSKDIWGKQMLQIYGSKLAVSSNTDKIKDFGIIEKFKFFHYRYFLLTDCLFISAFDNLKKGEEILGIVIKFYGERYRKKMQALFNAFYGVSDKEIITAIPEIKPIYEAIWKNRDFYHKEEKRIMITANMSAGKSTLLNALLGKKVNRMQNATCTAKMHYLHNKAGEDELIYEWDKALELDATQEALMDDNEDNKTTEIHVGARFRSLTEIDTKICFIDTPGVNSSMEKEHREMSNDAIKNIKCDLLLYLFNAENIGSDDDIRHLKYVKDNYKGKIIFLVNRMDRFKKNVDSVTETLKSVKKDLKQIGFKESQVYPISAYAAYLAKMSLYGEELSEDEEDDLNFLKRKLSKSEFAFETYYPYRIEQPIEKNNELTSLLVHSGILSLEKIIYNQEGEH